MLPYYSDLFCVGKENCPRPTALIKAKIHLGPVLLIASGSSKREPKEKYCLGFVAKNKATKPLSIKNMSSTGFGTINVLAEPSLPRSLRFHFLSPINEMLRFQSLPWQPSESPVMELHSRFPLRSSYVDRDAPSPRALFYISSRILSRGALPPASPRRGPIQRDAPPPQPSFTCLWQSPVKEPPSTFHWQGSYGERCSSCKNLFFISLLFHNEQEWW